MAGRLVLVATPIGNLGDLSPRAREELEAAEAWLVEDTRVSGKLRSRLGSSPPMKVLNDHTGQGKLDEYARELAAGARWALVTDAGTPVVSDPGAALVSLCHETGVEVTTVPGPSAVMAALCVSGFFAQRFAFLGYLPRKSGQAAEVLRPFADSTLTLVLFESPHRIGATFGTLEASLGSRRVAVCRELTKMHEQVWRGRLEFAPAETEVPRKGEFTIVVEGQRAGTRDKGV